MKYILDPRYQLRGWYKSSTGVFDTMRKEASFLKKEHYILLMQCDGAHDIDEDALEGDNKEFFDALKKAEIIREAGFLDYLKEKQKYRKYPARYKRNAQWSITGECNLRCRHCFMSAPHAKHGAPTKEQLINIADQLAECGVFTVGITGGEPLIREDLWEIIDALSEREIGVNTIYTNGWLVDETLLDKLDERKMHPTFQLSFDGIGWHDFLRGVPGAEEKTIKALKLLKERNYNVAVSMCIHRKNRSVLRDSIRLLASLGVASVKCGRMMELGEWNCPDMKDLQLTRKEELEVFEEYIPQYFEDDAPVSIMLSDTLMYNRGDSKWHFYSVRPLPEEEETAALSCGVLRQNFYIGAEGMVTPCMGMGDCNYAEHFPNLFETPLRDILRDSELITLSSVKVKEIRDHNPKCRKCPYINHCTGGCRSSVLMQGDDYYGIDEDVCYFFENGWDERLSKVAQDSFEAFIKRNPPKVNMDANRNIEETIDNCP